MTAFLTAAVAIWLLWIALCLVLMITARPRGASFNGFRVIIPYELREVLDADELEAVRQHELGHCHHWHVWINFALNCFFVKPSAERRRCQEIEADDFAAARVGRKSLESALRKLTGVDGWPVPPTLDGLRIARLQPGWPRALDTALLR